MSFFENLGIFGKVETTFHATIGIIIGVAFLALGLYLLLNNSNKKYLQLLGTVIDKPIPPSCDLQFQNNYICDVWVQYTINGESKTTKVTSYNNVNPLVPGNTITLYYNSSNNSCVPPDITTQNQNKLLIVEWIIIGVGLLLIIGCAISIYLVYKYKSVAMFEGSMEVVNDVISKL